jgi:uncharacterized protein (TIGR02145 family)
MKKFFLLSSLIIGFFSMCKKDKKNSVATVTTNTISNLTANSAQSGGKIADDGGSAITKKGICYAIHTNPTVADSVTSDGTGSANFVSNMTGLDANTTFYVKAYAINATGTAYGEEISFKTAAGLAAIKTSAVTDVVALSAKSGGNITNDGGSAITERGVVYGTSPNPTISNYKVTAGTGTGTFTATMAPLASQQTYYARAYAINSSGTAYGNQVQFNASSANTVTDIDGNVYPYVSVCGKDWLAANLKTTKYKNGDPITDGSGTSFNWLSYTNGAYAYPDNQQTNNAQYGKLYNLEAVRDSRGVCPTGWHVATDADWQAAEVCEGMDPSLASTNGDRCCGGLKFLETGTSGLEIKKVGYLFVDQVSGAKTYGGFNTIGQYWTGTVSAVSPTFNRYREFNIPGAPSADYIQRQSVDRSIVLPIRCVRD